MPEVRLIESVLRNTEQSFIPTRMRFEEIAPILPTLDEVGYYALDAWGGSSFEAELVYLGEDPWVRLRAMRKLLKKTKILMTFRGQNMLGYRNYGDDIVSYFVEKAASNGVDIIRVIDGLNDVRNMETSMKTAKKKKMEIQATMAYNECPDQDTTFFTNYAKQLEGMGANSICVKDVSGLLTPATTYQFVLELTKAVKIPIFLQLHGVQEYVSVLAYKAIEAGATGIDTSISTLGIRSALPSTEMIVKMLKGSPEEPKINQTNLALAHRFFAEKRSEYVEKEILSAKQLNFEKEVADYSISLGTIYNIIYQLEKEGKAELLPEILEEIQKVRSDCGMPPMVTPFAQIVSGQAILNVLAGSRYRSVTREFKGLVRGEFGKTPMKIERMFRSMIVGSDDFIDSRPADLIPEEMVAIRGELPVEYVEQDEDILTYAQFGRPAVDYFKRRRDEKYGIDSTLSDPTEKIYPV